MIDILTGNLQWYPEKKTLDVYIISLCSTNRDRIKNLEMLNKISKGRELSYQSRWCHVYIIIHCSRCIMQIYNDGVCIRCDHKAKMFLLLIAKFRSEIVEIRRAWTIFSHVVFSNRSCFISKRLTTNQQRYFVLVA